VGTAPSPPARLRRRRVELLRRPGPSPTQDGGGPDGPAHQALVHLKLPALTPATLMVDHANALARTRTDDGRWEELSRSLDDHESVLRAVADPHRAPEVLRFRQPVQAWRFYDQLRADAAARPGSQRSRRRPRCYPAMAPVWPLWSKRSASATPTLSTERLTLPSLDPAFRSSHGTVGSSFTCARRHCSVRSPPGISPTAPSATCSGSLRCSPLGRRNCSCSTNPRPASTTTSSDRWQPSSPRPPRPARLSLSLIRVPWLKASTLPASQQTSPWSRTPTRPGSRNKPS